MFYKNSLSLLEFSFFGLTDYYVLKFFIYFFSLSFYIGEDKTFKQSL
jgi:hypothetical protein